MQQQHINHQVKTNIFVKPWHSTQFDAPEVTPVNFHRRCRRQEVQLPLPETNPIIRANVLLEESMRHNWAANAKCFQQHSMLKAQSQGRQVDPRQLQEELEFMWFQFRCEWQQLRTDVLSEMFRVPVPEVLKPKVAAKVQAEADLLGSEEREAMLRDQAAQIEAARKTYLEELRQAFYPTTLMELFQKDLAPFEADMNLCLLPSGRGHWAQLQATYLYQQQLAQQAHEAERMKRQAAIEKMTLANLTTDKAPEIAIELCEIDLDEDDDDDTSSASSSHAGIDISSYHLQPVQRGGAPRSDTSSCDDASSICGMSSAESAISSSRSFATGEYDQFDSQPSSNPGSRSNRSTTKTHSPTSSIDGAMKRTNSGCSEDICYPSKPMAQYQPPAHLNEVMEALTQLTTTEGQQCPLEYHSVRFDEETRAQVFMSRRERKAYILAAMPQGRLFMTV